MQIPAERPTRRDGSSSVTVSARIGASSERRSRAARYEFAPGGNERMRLRASICAGAGARCRSACRCCATTRMRPRGVFAAPRRARSGTARGLSFDPAEDVAAPYIAVGARPAVAVLREQGVNSQTEMAAVFTRAGFDAYDVHMTDILARRVRLALPRNGRVRRVLLRRCARRRRGLGEVDSVQSDRAR